MSDNRKTDESEENPAADKLSRMARDYIQLWQKQWVETMTDPKTQETMREYYASLNGLYEKNKHIFTRYAEAMKHGTAGTAETRPSAAAPSGEDKTGASAVYATLEQCLNVLERFGERITALETRVDELEQSARKPARKSSAAKRGSDNT